MPRGVTPRPFDVDVGADGCAAVAAVRSGSEADIERFAALVRQRNGSDAGRFAAVSVGAVGSTLDEPDVAALYHTLGLDAAPTPRGSDCSAPSPRSALPQRIPDILATLGVSPTVVP